MSMDDTYRVVNAISVTNKVVNGYFDKTVQQRLNGGAGSVFPEFTSIEEATEALMAVDYEKYEVPNLLEGTTAFRTDIPGLLGVVKLEDIPHNLEVTLDDRKGTGKISCLVSISDLGYDPRTVVEHTVIILGMEQNVEVVFTVHPGDPVSPSKVEAEKGMHGKRITVEEAIKLGLTTAKVTE